MEYIEKSDILVNDNTTKIFSGKNITLLCSILLFVSMLNFLPFDKNINQGLSLFTLAAILWFSEAVHLSVTALLIPILAVCLGIFDTKTAMGGFSHPIIYLFFGGFVIAAAINNQGIDKFLAKKLLTISNGKLSIACMLLFLITAGLSMWISNVATTTIMLPLSLGLLNQLCDKQYRSTYVFVLLGVAYSANIGGLGTVIGCAPNAIAAAQVGVDFTQWLSFGLPTVALMLPIMALSLYLILKPELNIQCKVTDSNESLSNPAKLTLLIFLTTALCWMNSKSLATIFGGVKYFDTIIALTAVVALVASKLVDWSKIQSTTDWGVLLLFGGGLTLSQVLKVTGTSTFLAHQLASIFSGTHPAVFVLLIISFVIMLTEFASNTASATLLVPIFVALADAFALPPMMVAVLVGMAASFAFMLPVATPPNAIVYGTGYIQQKQMVRAGVFINLAGVLVLFSIASLFWDF